MSRPDPAFPALQDAMRVGMGDGQAPFDASAQTLDDLIGSSAGLAEVSAGIASNQAQDEADRLFGWHIREAITEAHGADVARVVMRAFCDPTKPGTAARKVQNKVHGILVGRLDKIVQEVRGNG